MSGAIVGHRKARSEYCITVELQPHELPPKPNPVEKFVAALESAVMWAPELGEDLLDRVRELIESAHAKAPNGCGACRRCATGAKAPNGEAA